MSIPRISTEWERLFALEDSILKDRLLDTLSTLEVEAGPVNFDRIMGAGRKFALAGQQNKDELAVSWLASNPNPRRLDIVSAFLSGIWSNTASEHSVNPKVLEDFIELRKRMSLDDEVAYSSLVPIASVGTSTSSVPVKWVAKRALESATLEQYNNPKTAEMARELISETIRHLDGEQTT
jgi:hypothetical protein